jgi:hypothetical protein
VWRRAMRSPDVQARFLGMSGDARVEWQLVRDAQRYQESALYPLSARAERGSKWVRRAARRRKHPGF